MVFYHCHGSFSEVYEFRGPHNWANLRIRGAQRTAAAKSSPVSAYLHVKARHRRVFLPFLHGMIVCLFRCQSHIILYRLHVDP